MRRWRNINQLLAEQTIVITEERVRPQPIGVAIEKHQDHQCRWPLEGVLFCGADIEAPVHERSRPVYCKGHAQIAYESRVIKETH
jgi:hypothetical protein